MNEFNRTRAKILGVLIRDARLYAGRSLEDCANLLGITVERFEQVEFGEEVLALQDLEVLAMYLQVPLGHFWGDKTLGYHHRVTYQDVLKERRRSIGELLKEVREKNGRSVQDLAEEIDTTPDTIRKYESGASPIPLFDLDRMARYLGHSLNYFVDDEHGLLAEHEAAQKIQRHLDELPEDMRKFVSEPINQSYLEIAMRLSEMDVKSLRTVAENILNITF